MFKVNLGSGGSDRNWTGCNRNATISWGLTSDESTCSSLLYDNGLLAVSLEVEIMGHFRQSSQFKAEASPPYESQYLKWTHLILELSDTSTRVARFPAT